MARTYRPATLPATRPDLQLAVASRDIGRAANAAALQPKLARWLHRTETPRSAPNARRRAIRIMCGVYRPVQEQNRNFLELNMRQSPAPNLATARYLSSHQSSRRFAL